ncbi:MAG: tyrosine-protein kinase family protein, partial [bacterium]
STIAQEGKSHTSVNLARSFSFSEKKVLIIETDIRVPRVETYLKLNKNAKGLTDYIGDPSLKLKDVIVQPKDNKYLSIIPSGTIPPNPAELLMSDRINGLFEEVQSNYDVIIVDTSAVGLVTDTLLIGHHADLFIHVVSAEKVDKNQLNIVQSLYDEKRLPNMTVLLNGTVKRMGYGYGYGYGNGGKKKKRFGII